MKFHVTRTSQWDDKTPPCPEASRGMIEVWDARTCASAEEFDRAIAAKFRKETRWLDRGTDHQQVQRPDGTTYIKRRLEDREAWFVEIGALDELIAFADRYGELVVGSEPPSIEIYDGYRE